MSFEGISRRSHVWFKERIGVLVKMLFKFLQDFIPRFSTKSVADSRLFTKMKRHFLRLKNRTNTSYTSLTMSLFISEIYTELEFNVLLKVNDDLLGFSGFLETIILRDSNAKISRRLTQAEHSRVAHNALLTLRNTSRQGANRKQKAQGVRDVCMIWTCGLL